MSRRRHLRAAVALVLAGAPRVRADCNPQKDVLGCQTTNTSSALMIVGCLMAIVLAFGLRLWHRARLRRARAVRVRHARAALERRTEPVDMTQGWSWVEVNGLARPAQAYMGPPPGPPPELEDVYASPPPRYEPKDALSPPSDPPPRFEDVV